MARPARPAPLFLVLALLSGVRTASGSPFHVLEYIHHDIMNAKPVAGRLFEVEILAVDSLWTYPEVMKMSALPMSCGSRCDSQIVIDRSVYRLTVQVLQNITVLGHPTHIPLVAIDDRDGSDYRWQEYWVPEKRKGRKFILVLGKRGRVRALYESRSFYTLDIHRSLKLVLARDLRALLDDAEYRGYINRKVLKGILRREKVLE